MTNETPPRGAERALESTSAPRLQFDLDAEIRGVSHAGAEETIDLPAGHLVALDRNLQHHVEAEVDSAFLLTVAWPDRSEPEVSHERR